MIKTLDNGALYCTFCARVCDELCWTRCENYFGVCGTCKHFREDGTYCDDCLFYGENKWEDKYLHGGTNNE